MLRLTQPPGTKLGWMVLLRSIHGLRGSCRQRANLLDCVHGFFGGLERQGRLPSVVLACLRVIGLTGWTAVQVRGLLLLQHLPWGLTPLDLHQQARSDAVGHQLQCWHGWRCCRQRAHLFGMPLAQRT